MPDDIYDLVVIGGGVNGAGIAADAATRGLRVLLAEAEDLGGATSSASSKLIHGGLRYLEHYEFRLVRKALAEREVLLAKAQHIIRPMRFVLPHAAGMRSRFLIRAGLFLYDHLAARKSLGGSHSVDLHSDPAGAPLRAAFAQGFSYWDCAVDDARLVVLNAIAAGEAGARIMTRTPVRALRAEARLWIVSFAGGGEVAARTVVNAAGPWVGDVARLGAMPGANPGTVRLVKGSHIVVPRITGARDAYTLQNGDGRVVFALPFEDAFTLIGTTEEPQPGNPRAAHVSDEEEAYLLEAANRYFRVPLTREQIVWRFAGVRPLDDDGQGDASAVTRDYRFVVEDDATPPILHVIGGKITTYRVLAEAAVDRLRPYFSGLGPCRTRTMPLPGGDFGGCAFEAWFDDFCRSHDGFARTSLLGLARRHGAWAARVIGDASSERDMGREFAPGLRLREIAYLKAAEWAQTAEDILWRRTKAGLHIAPAARSGATDAIEDCLRTL